MRSLVALMLLSGVARADLFLEERVEKPAQIAQGPTTTLWKSGHWPVMPTHDGPEGETTFEVRHGAKQVGKPLALPGGGRCLGWSNAAKAYVVGSVHEIGVLLLMPSVELLDENGVAHATAIEHDGRAAYTIVLSASGRWAAFIGFGTDDRIGLFALDLVTDKIRALGAAPAPPPDDAYSKKRWTWGVEGEEGYMDIEPDVMRFDGEVLRVSYGKDTSKRRNKVRTVRTFDLSR